MPRTLFTWCLSMPAAPRLRAGGRVVFGTAREHPRTRGELLRVLLVGLLLLAAGCGDAPPIEATVEAAPALPSAGEWLVVPEDLHAETLKHSVHAELDCADCHAPESRGSASSARSPYTGATRCVPCHEREVRDYDQSVHAAALSHGKTGAARCRHCHGAHDIQKVADPASPVSKLQLATTCGRCHQKLDSVTQSQLLARRPGGIQDLGMHRRVLVTQGLMAAPSCADCHGGSHVIRRALDHGSATARSQIPRTCGKCHAGPEADFRRSTHGSLWASGNLDVPVCTDCHLAHDRREGSARARLSREELCGSCHATQLKRYLQTYHGKALRLGHGEVATCYDCHGTHAILPASDPASTIAPAERLQTCRQCHPEASPRFAAFMAHGDHTDRQQYPLLYWTFMLMTGLIVGTFAAWGVHTLLWAWKMLRDIWRDPPRFRAERRALASAEAGPVYVRFQPVDRFCHALVITSFLLLVATGMPLKFHETAWAQLIFRMLGGPQVAAMLHRVGAFLSLIYLLTHGSRLAAALVRSRRQLLDERQRFSVRRLLGWVFGPESPLPNPHDARDVTAHVKWFFGRGPRPHFDRFTYWEKFDYLAELWGSAFIGLSGLILWFPEKVTLVAPGWLINVAHVIHSQEALLAAGFILTFHFFNAHFRTEKFPLDTVMFSGRITQRELLHERRRQYDRLLAENRLEELVDRPNPTGARWIWQTWGLLFVYGGLGLAALIFWTMGKRWLGG
jgi:cytochrome b subunit of formate dehydrogenase